MTWGEFYLSQFREGTVGTRPARSAVLDHASDLEPWLTRGAWLAHVARAVRAFESARNVKQLPVAHSLVA